MPIRCRNIPYRLRAFISVGTAVAMAKYSSALVTCPDSAFSIASLTNVCRIPFKCSIGISILGISIICCCRDTLEEFATMLLVMPFTPASQSLKRSIAWISLSSSGMTQSSNLTGILNVLVRGSNSALLLISFNSFWKYPSFDSDFLDRHIIANSQLLIASLIVSFHLSPGSICSLSIQILIPLFISSLFKFFAISPSSRM